MALTIRNLPDAILPALVLSMNGLRKQVTANQTSYPHADTTCGATTGDFSTPSASPLIVTAASATTLATTAALANQLKKYLNVHLADATAHKVADATNVITAPDAGAADQTATNTLLNAIYTAYNAHLTQSGVHYTNDTTNAASSSSATDLASSETRANDLATKANTHIQFALGDRSLIVSAA